MYQGEKMEEIKKLWWTRLKLGEPGRVNMYRFNFSGGGVFKWDERNSYFHKNKKTKNNYNLLHGVVDYLYSFLKALYIYICAGSLICQT